MTDVVFSSKNMAWGTPQDLYDRLDSRYDFTLDAAASDTNHKCEATFPIDGDWETITWKGYFTKEDDGLVQSWKGHRVFCNPPYGRELGKWVKKAYDEFKNNKVLVVMLIPARTDTAYWHDYIFDNAKVVFIRGRIHFVDDAGESANSAPFPSAVVVFDPHDKSIIPYTTLDDLLGEIKEAA